MQCFSGLSLSSGEIVPCGQCMNCRVNKARKWTGRILAEMMGSPPRCNWFLTLTISDENLHRAPPHAYASLEKGAFSLWLRAWQRANGAFRYYAVGEYGDLSRRPHYHLAMFHSSPEFMWSFGQDWEARWGHFLYSEMGDKRAAYLAQYTTKKLTSPDDDRLGAGGALEGCEPEFRTSSRHPPLGYRFARALIAQYRTPQGRAVLEQQGDVARCFRACGKIYPFDAYMLRMMRTALGIPLSHTGRIDAHPNYLDYHQTKDAEQCLQKTLQAEVIHAQKKAALSTRRISV